MYKECFHGEIVPFSFVLDYPGHLRDVSVRFTSRDGQNEARATATIDTVSSGSRYIARAEIEITEAAKPGSYDLSSLDITTAGGQRFSYNGIDQVEALFAEDYTIVVLEEPGWSNFRVGKPSFTDDPL